ncbi:MAG TPA: serine/threonine-protein kinase [Vicinamibacterales bacterium]|nr:serine/threonine-protein kinase [Vicinamibacterales bacterium]
MPDPVLEDLAGAVADGEAVDWEYVASTVPPAFVRHFQSIAEVGASGAGADSSVRHDAPRGAVPLWLQGFALLATSHIVGALVAALVQPPDRQAVPAFPVLANLLVFAVSGWVLLAGGGLDRRARHLGALFLAIATALAPRFLRLAGPLPAPLLLWRHAYLDAFVPLMLWLFVRDFPRLGRFTRFDRVARVAIVASAVAGVVLFLANLILAIGAPSAAGLLLRLSRNDRPSFYWIVLFLLALPALPVAIGRTRRATGAERRRVRLFAFGLLTGSAPMLGEVIVGIMFPASRAWLARPGAMAAGAYVLYGFLALMPVISAYSVLVQKVLTVRLFVARALRYALARYTLLSLAILPVAGFLIYLASHRQETVGALLTSRTAALASITLAASLLLLRVRRSLLAWLDRVFLRVDSRPQDALASFGARAAGAESIGEIVGLLAEHVQRTLGVDHVYVLAAQGELERYVPLHGVCQPLPRQSALAALVADATGAVNVDRADRRSVFSLLPQEDRQWVLDAEATALQPMPGHHGHARTLLVVGPRRIERGLSRDDLLFLASVTAAASLALENRAIRDRASQVATGPASGADEELAAECASCGRVQRWDPPQCAVCGGRLGPAAIPAVLLGKFAVVAALGRGGMGVVYKATDIVLGRTVAVKTLPRLSADAARRLRHEARAMATVTHPNLALIFGAETWRDTPFLVVEFLEGGTLADRLATGPLPVREALALCATLAGVLDRIHAAGILHRDIKPSNIGFAADGTAKLLDFGLARLLDDSSANSVDDRMTGPTAAWAPLASRHMVPTAPYSQSYLAGTPLYLSPEAIAGEVPDASFDLWSLGIVLYESLTGRPPFTGGSVAEIFAAIQQTERQTLGGGLHHLPDEVGDYVCSVLSTDKRRRPGSPEAFAAGLKRLLAG